MEITYALSPVMYVVFAVFYPLAAPIAWVLDHTLGEGEGVTTFSKMELSALMKIQEVCLTSMLIQNSLWLPLKDRENSDCDVSKCKVLL